MKQLGTGAGNFLILLGWVAVVWLLIEIVLALCERWFGV